MPHNLRGIVRASPKTLFSILLQELSDDRSCRDGNIVWIVYIFVHDGLKYLCTYVYLFMRQ